MSSQHQSSQASRPAGEARDLQAKLYRDIGISAVAAALRFANQPEPPARPAADNPSYPPAHRSTLAA